jgi:transposase
LVGFQNGAFDAVDGASRQLQALGHIVRLLPPSYVKAYLKRSKKMPTRTITLLLDG